MEKIMKEATYDMGGPINDTMEKNYIPETVHEVFGRDSLKINVEKFYSSKLIQNIYDSIVKCRNIHYIVHNIFSNTLYAYGVLEKMEEKAHNIDTKRLSSLEIIDLSKIDKNICEFMSSDSFIQTISDHNMSSLFINTLRDNGNIIKYRHKKINDLNNK